MTTPHASMPPRDPSAPRHPPVLPGRFALLLLFIFLAVLIRTAWIRDDGMIPLRTVMNVTHGYGLTQNGAERVQTFTHALWLLLLTAAYLVVGNVYYATFIVNVPAQATRDGFDTITVEVGTGDDRAYAVGHFLRAGYAQTDPELQQRVAARNKQ